jgi:hypothetical protein
MQTFPMLQFEPADTKYYAEKLSIMFGRSVALENSAALSNHYIYITKEQNTVSNIPPRRVLFAHLMVSVKFICGHNITRQEREVTLTLPLQSSVHTLR